MSLRQKVLHSLFWIGGTRLLGQAVTWLITIVVIRILTPDDYGLLALATVFVGFLSIFAEAGLGSALVQAPEVDDGKLRAIFAAAILINSAFILLLIACAPFIAHFFSDTRLASVITVLSAQLVLSVFTVIPAAMLTRRLDFRRLSLVSVTGAICGSLHVGPRALGYGVWSLVGGNLVGAALNTAALNFIAPFLRWPDFSFRGARRLLVFGGQFTGARILWYL
jgi:O-antigen/teichoic acid export membrane protein